MEYILFRIKNLKCSMWPKFWWDDGEISRLWRILKHGFEDGTLFSSDEETGTQVQRRDTGKGWTHPIFTLQLLHVEVWRTNRLCLQPDGLICLCVTLLHKVSVAWTWNGFNPHQGHDVSSAELKNVSPSKSNICHPSIFFKGVETRTMVRRCAS